MHPNRRLICSPRLLVLRPPERYCDTYITPSSSRGQKLLEDVAANPGNARQRWPMQAALLLHPRPATWRRGIAGNVPEGHPEALKGPEVSQIVRPRESHCAPRVTVQIKHALQPAHLHSPSNRRPVIRE